MPRFVNRDSHARVGPRGAANSMDGTSDSIRVELRGGADSKDGDGDSIRIESGGGAADSMDGDSSRPGDNPMRSSMVSATRLASSHHDASLSDPNNVSSIATPRESSSSSLGVCPDVSNWCRPGQHAKRQ